MEVKVKEALYGSINIGIGAFRDRGFGAGGQLHEQDDERRQTSAKAHAHYQDASRPHRTTMCTDNQSPMTPCAASGLA